MLLTIFYGFSIGAILYFISIGLSLTFGTMRVVNFAHTLTYSIGVYVLITFIPWLKGNFIPAAIIAILAVIPISYVIERFIIRRLYGESLDYTFIATFAITLIGRGYHQIDLGRKSPSLECSPQDLPRLLGYDLSRLSDHHLCDRHCPLFWVWSFSFARRFWERSSWPPWMTRTECGAWESGWTNIFP